MDGGKAERALLAQLLGFGLQADALGVSCGSGVVQVLELQRATRFIPTSPENYKGIETAARSAGLLK